MFTLRDVKSYNSVMRKSFLLYIALGLIVVLGTLHFMAEVFHLYWVYWWLDIVVHFLAGFSGSLVLAWFFGPLGMFRAIFYILIFMFAVGIAWEIFEYVNDLVQPIDYWQDTISDLIADMLGSGLVCFYVYASGQTPKSS